MILKRPNKIVSIPEVNIIELSRKENGIDVTVNGVTFELFRCKRSAVLYTNIEFFIHGYEDELDLENFLTFSQGGDNRRNKLFLELAADNIHEIKRVFQNLGKTVEKK